MQVKLAKDLKKIISIALICVLALLCSCQDSIPNRALIAPQQNVGTTSGSTTGGGSSDTPTRPTNAIFFKNDFCICRDKKAISSGSNCSTFCSTRNTNGAETFFANFTVTEAISRSGLGSVAGWCSTPLETETETPSCALEAKDDQGNVVNLEVAPVANSNSIIVNNVQNQLEFDKTYVITLIQKSSGSKSNSVNLIKFSSDINNPNLGPLKPAPISQYTCVIRTGTEDDQTGDEFYDTAYRLHFYFVPRLPPTPLPPGSTRFFCHNIFDPLFGKNDKEGIPRLETIAGAFSLWDNTDPRFYNLNGDPNNLIDVNEIIIQKTKNFGGSIPNSSNFFIKFPTLSSPNTNTDAGNTTVASQEIGFYMPPWIDPTTFKSYCLTSFHYNSENPLFKAIGSVIQYDTEGLYVGMKSGEPIVVDGKVQQGEKDFIFVKESDLKAVWFYFKNGVPTIPTEDIVSNVATYFYYPIDKNAPYEPANKQGLYRVQSAAELNNSNVNNTSSTTTGSNTTLPPHDRKIGCVPKP